MKYIQNFILNWQLLTYIIAVLIGICVAQFLVTEFNLSQPVEKYTYAHDPVIERIVANNPEYSTSVGIAISTRLKAIDKNHEEIEAPRLYYYISHNQMEIKNQKQAAQILKQAIAETESNK